MTAEITPTGISSGLSTSALLELFQITKSDLTAIRTAGEALGKKVGALTGHFYKWLKTQPEYEDYFADPSVQKRVANLQETYWVQFFGAEFNSDYVANLERIGAVHARIGLPLRVYLAAMNTMKVLITKEVVASELSAEQKQKAVDAIASMLNLESTVVVETYSDHRNQAIADRTKTLMEMSTPVTQIWEGILMLPLVGIIDSKRAQEIMNSMLEKIAQTQAQNFILDISGVAVVDTAVANHLIKITKATELMGCETIISGISPAIAQTIVDLGIEVGRVRTTSTMRDALSTAFRRVGQELRPIHSKAQQARKNHVRG
jgi:rsbT co-antagonist protein RsbR